MFSKTIKVLSVYFFMLGLDFTIFTIFILICFSIYRVIHWIYKDDVELIRVDFLFGGWADISFWRLILELISLAFLIIVFAYFI